MVFDMAHIAVGSKVGSKVSKRLRKPNLFIVGEPKCGTTALWNMFEQHPQVFTEEIKEVNYFSQDLTDKWFKDEPRLLKYFKKTEGEYLKVFEHAKNEKYILDASVINLFSKESARKIYKFNPEAKIIAIFREPIDFLRAYHIFRQGPLQETEPDFFKALGNEDKYKKEGKPSYLYYSEWIKYDEHLERYLKIFNIKQIKVIIYEDFKKDNKGVFNEICDLLDIEKNLPISFKRVNKRRTTKNRFIIKIVDTPTVWVNARKLIPRPTLEMLKKIYFYLVTTYAEKISLPEEEVMKIKKKYRGNVLKFEKLLKHHKIITNDFNLIKYWGF